MPETRGASMPAPRAHKAVAAKTTHTNGPWRCQLMVYAKGRERSGKRNPRRKAGKTKMRERPGVVLEEEPLEEGRREGNRLGEPQEGDPSKGDIGDADEPGSRLSGGQQGLNRGHTAQREGHLARSPTVEGGGQAAGRESARQRRQALASPRRRRAVHPGRSRRSTGSAGGASRWRRRQRIPVPLSKK